MIKELDFLCVCVLLPSMDFLSDFEMMLQRKKNMSGKRRRNRDGGTFISDADDVVSAMIVKMNEAAEVGCHFLVTAFFPHKIDGVVSFFLKCLTLDCCKRFVAFCDKVCTC